MKTVIYYFTGTGNSLAAAQQIATLLGDCDLVPIAPQMNSPGKIVPEADRVGIVCPVYDCGLPSIVAAFAGRLSVAKVRYLFAVVTMGGMGVSALHQLDGIFKRREGRGLDAAFAVPMPGNFPPLYPMTSDTKTDEILKKADIRIGEVAGAIARGAKAPPGFSPLSAVMKAITYGPFLRDVHGRDAAFTVSDACTSCGTCAKVCPVGNITLENDRPVWHHRCELCCACLHFCPTEAIQLDILFGTEGRGRYRHPGLTIADMEAQRGKQPEDDAGEA